MRIKMCHRHAVIKYQTNGTDRLAQHRVATSLHFVFKRANICKANKMKYACTDYDGEGFSGSPLQDILA